MLTQLRRIRFLASTAALALVAAAPSALSAQEPAAAPAAEAEIVLPEGVTRVASVEGITEYRLDNGLQVLLFPDRSKQRPAPLALGAGLLGGLAALLEHFDDVAALFASVFEDRHGSIRPFSVLT